MTVAGLQPSVDAKHRCYFCDSPHRVAQAMFTGQQRACDDCARYWSDPPRKQLLGGSCA